MSQTKTYTIKGVPADQVDQFIAVAKNDKRYVSHEIQSEPDGEKTITVTIKLDAHDSGANTASNQ